MIKRPTNRREFIQKFLAANTFLFGGVWTMSGCNSKQSEEEQIEEVVSGDPCEDMTNISESELAKRKQLGYMEKSPIPENVCNNCQLYIPAKTEKDCGGCLLFKGPVYAEAYCTYWAPQV